MATDGDPFVIDSPGFQAELAAEAADLEDQAGSYLKYWPIISLGLKIGLGT